MANQQISGIILRKPDICLDAAAPGTQGFEEGNGPPVVIMGMARNGSDIDRHVAKDGGHLLGIADMGRPCKHRGLRGSACFVKTDMTLDDQYDMEDTTEVCKTIA